MCGDGDSYSHPQGPARGQTSSERAENERTAGLELVTVLVTVLGSWWTAGLELLTLLATVLGS